MTPHGVTGAQYWIENMPYASDSLPRYAILFDMVGGVGAKFHREFFSDSEASQLVDKVRSVAERSGFGDRFINKNGGSVVDDHIFLNKAGIPAIDIIETKNDETGSFAPTGTQPMTTSTTSIPPPCRLQADRAQPAPQRNPVCAVTAPHIPRHKK